MQSAFGNAPAIRFDGVDDVLEALGGDETADAVTVLALIAPRSNSGDFLGDSAPLGTLHLLTAEFGPRETNLRIDGDVAEIILYGRVLSILERDAIEKLLLEKYGL